LKNSLNIPYTSKIIPVIGQRKSTSTKPNRNTPVPHHLSSDPKNNFRVLFKPIRVHIPETNNKFPSVSNEVSKKKITPRNINISPNTVSPIPILRSLFNIPPDLIAYRGK